MEEITSSSTSFCCAELSLNSITVISVRRMINSEVIVNNIPFSSIHQENITGFYIHAITITAACASNPNFDMW